MVSERQRCAALKKDGTPCQGYATRNGLCVGHQPNSNEARRKGGLNSAKKVRADKLLPLRLRPILEALEKAMAEVHEGTLDHRKGAAMASIANAITKVYESGVMEERLKSLEDRICPGGGDNGNRKAY